MLYREKKLHLESKNYYILIKSLILLQMKFQVWDVCLKGSENWKQKNEILQNETSSWILNLFNFICFVLIYKSKFVTNQKLKWNICSAFVFQYH